MSMETNAPQPISITSLANGERIGLGTVEYGQILPQLVAVFLENKVMSLVDRELNSRK